MAPKESKEEDIRKLIQGCIKEDRSAQKELYRYFYALSMGICQRYANNKLDASSIMNEGFYKVFKNIKKYDFTKPFTAWISRIMTNSAIDFYRANLKFLNNDDIIEHDHAGSDNSIYERIDYQDLLVMIQNLSPAYRAVFNLYAIEGYTHEEIADILRISIGTSKSNLFKARAKLMEMLKKYETQPPSVLGDMDFNE